jgi:hypothetical protein
VYPELLREVEMQARRYGAAALQPPCAEQAVRALRLRVRDELGLPLPVEFEEFLRIADGLNWNGLYLYPSADLVESNLDQREVAGLEDVLVFGNDSLDLFAWRASTGEFQALDLVPRQVMETLPSFDALMGVALARCLNS